MAMDPCAVYRRAVTDALPNARIVADHFRLVRLANQAVTHVRQRTTRETLSRRGRSSDPAWASRRRLLRGRERLSEQAFTRMWNDLIDAEPTGQLLAAWIAKEELRALLATARRGGQRHDIAHRLYRFYDWCARVDIPEVPPSTPGGPRSSASSKPASRTPEPKAETASSKTPPAWRSASDP